MAVDSSLSTLLSTLTGSLASAASALPASESLVPPGDGISLLDTKNELLLSYLQNLVFLIIIKLRNHAGASTDSALDGDVVRKLIELRVYLERGIRPLESRLKYQIDKVIRAADDADRAAASNTVARDGASKGATGKGPADGPESGGEDEDREGAAGRELTNGANTEGSIDELAFRPNPASFKRVGPCED